MRRREFLKASGMAVAGAVATLQTTRSLFAQGRACIERDVCVVGGGSSGTYMAVRLGDYGKSVVLLEATDRLGGHAQTYIDPSSHIPIDIGVVVFEPTTYVTDYFKRFNVDYGPIGFDSGTPVYVDLNTGLPLTDYTPPTAADIGAALYAYQTVLAEKYPYLDAGFQLPDPVPEELTQPFSQFVETYSLQAMVPLLFLYTQGSGNLLDDPALYVLKLFGLSLVTAILADDLITIKNGTIQLYSAAAHYLGSNVLFNTRIASIDRSGPTIKVLANTPHGPVTILCKTLLWSAPPTLGNLAPVDLDVRERRVFGALRSKCYTTGLAAISGIPQGIVIDNMAPGTPYNLPSLPGLYTLRPTAVDGLYLTLFGSQHALPDNEIEAIIRAQIASLADIYPVAFDGFKIFSNHTPFQIGVSGHEIAAGFYTRMNALQGYRNTYYNSAAFQTNDSSLIWQFTESLLPQIVG